MQPMIFKQKKRTHFKNNQNHKMSKVPDGATPHPHTHMSPNKRVTGRFGPVGETKQRKIAIFLAKNHNDDGCIFRDDII